jgi:class 3 adenylate cyclase
MEPRIQYARTSDGVNIAYATYGEGPPLVIIMNPAGSHVQLEWEEGPLMKAAITAYAPHRRVIRFDQRGVGLSDRDVEDVSLDARVRDLEAVVSTLGLGTFEVIALETGGHLAIALAAQHSDRVAKLVLINCYARGRAAAETTRGRAIARLTDDWELLTNTAGANNMGMSHEEAMRYGAFIRKCLDRDMWVRLDDAQQQIDVTNLCPQVRSPTLILRHSGIEWLSMDATRELAASIPGSRLVMIEGLYPDRPGDLFRAVAEFLGLSRLPRAAASAPAASGDTHTILFTDMEQSTALTQRLGDARAQELLRAHNAIVREALGSHGGAEIKHTGDGIMASFPTASGALECAVAIQRAVAGQDNANLQVHVGLNAGEPVAEDEDLFGTAVQLARRICDEAASGEILASNVVRELSAGKGFLFADRGAAALKGFEDPVRLYEVRWQES